MKPGKRKMLRKDKASDVLVNALEKLKAGIRAKVEHPFRVVKRQFGYTKVRYRGSEEEHGPTGLAICALQLVDGAGQMAGDAGMSAPANKQTAREAIKAALAGAKGSIDSRTRQLLLTMRNITTRYHAWV